MQPTLVFALTHLPLEGPFSKKIMSICSRHAKEILRRSTPSSSASFVTLAPLLEEGWVTRHRQLVLQSPSTLLSPTSIQNHHFPRRFSAATNNDDNHSESSRSSNSINEFSEKERREEESSQIGVTVTTESGLRYVEVLIGGTEGQNSNGDDEEYVASVGDNVHVHYDGYLDEGRKTKFDTSYETGIPADFTIGNAEVIPGWEECMIGMKLGSKRQVIVPPHLGYGSSGVGKIPPNATLYFDIHLTKIIKGPKNMKERLFRIFGIN